MKHKPYLLTLEKKAPGFRDQVPGATSTHLLRGAQDQLLGAGKISFLLGPQEPFLATVKRRKLALFWHVTHHDSLSKTVLQGTLEGGRHRVRQRKCSMDNMKEWTSLPMPELAHNGLLQKRLKEDLR